MSKTTVLSVSVFIIGLLSSKVFAAQQASASKPNPQYAEWSKQCVDWDDWDKPGPPFRIFGNTYYVGTCGISALLIVGGKGHVLIDSGTQIGAEYIAKNIEELGFQLTDIKLLLNSHEHFDHVGGMATLQSRTGATLLTSPRAASVMRTGKVSIDDPQFGMHDDFPSVKLVELVEELQSVTLGELSFKPIFTPGHTPGAISWQWQSCQDKQCLSLVYADSLSPVSRDDYRFSDHPEYIRTYRNGLDKLAKLECDILLAPHPSASQMPRRLNAKQGLVNSSGCIDYSARVLHRLEKRLQKEAAIKAN